MTTTKNGIQQLRPPPLKISKNSHLIQKPIIVKNNNNIPLPPLTSNNEAQQQRQPMIIYAQSPKVIHTNAKDFLKLVQQLTGMTSSNVNGDKEEIGRREEDCMNMTHSLVTLARNGESTVSSPAVKVARFDVSTRPMAFFADIPLYTPNSSDYVCTTRMYRNSLADVLVPTSMVVPEML